MQNGTGVAEGSGTPSDPVRVTVLVRPDCRTCDRMVLVVEAICAEAGEEYASVSVDDDPELRGEYGDRVPVLLVDGEELASWRVEPDDLRRALA